MSDKCMVKGSRAVGAALQDWHFSAGDPIYVVGSHWYAGHAVECHHVEDAISMLNRIRLSHSTLKGRRKATREGRAAATKNRRVLTRLINALRSSLSRA